MAARSFEPRPRQTVALIGAGDRPPRALLASAAVLVLDRPTPPLDPRTASEVIKDVFSAAGNQTVLVIAHRSEGLDRVDRVVSMAAEEMTASGIQT